MGLFSVSNILLQYIQRITFFFFFPDGTRGAISVLKLLDWSIGLALYSAWPLSSHISLEAEICDLSFERSKSPFLDCFVFIYLYYSLCPGISVHDMKHCFLALTILRRKAKTLVKCQHWYGLKKNTAALAVRVYVISWWSSFMRSAITFILQISNWDTLDKCNSFLEIVEGALRVQIHAS